MFTHVAIGGDTTSMSPASDVSFVAAVTVTVPEGVLVPLAAVPPVAVPMPAPVCGMGVL